MPITYPSTSNHSYLRLMSTYTMQTYIAYSTKRKQSKYLNVKLPYKLFIAFSCGYIHINERHKCVPLMKRMSYRPHTRTNTVYPKYYVNLYMANHILSIYLLYNNVVVFVDTILINHLYTKNISQLLTHMVININLNNQSKHCNYSNAFYLYPVYTVFILRPPIHSAMLHLGWNHVKCWSNVGATRTIDARVPAESADFAVALGIGTVQFSLFLVEHSSHPAHWFNEELLNTPRFVTKSGAVIQYVFVVGQYASVRIVAGQQFIGANAGIVWQNVALRCDHTTTRTTMVLNGVGLECGLRSGIGFEQVLAVFKLKNVWQNGDVVKFKCTLVSLVMCTLTLLDAITSQPEEVHLVNWVLLVDFPSHQTEQLQLLDESFVRTNQATFCLYPIVNWC